jgi:hypothetical protein
MIHTDFYVETLTGKNHGRTKAYFHYNGGVLQARDDIPFLVRLLGYIYEGNIQESLEDKK